MSITYAQNTIAKTLGYRGVKDPDRVAHEVLEALRSEGVHLITVPTFTTDPAEGTPEYEATMGEMARYSADPRTIKRVLSATVDNEALTATMVISPHEAAMYKTDDGLREHTRRKMGMDLLAAMWKRFDPDAPVSP
jgi:hypothetical protein